MTLLRPQCYRNPLVHFIKNSHLNRLLLCATVLVALSGCIVGPTYEPPDPCVPPRWHHSDGSSVIDQCECDDENCAFCAEYREGNPFDVSPIQTKDCPWWEDFLDEDLRALIAIQRYVSPTLHELRARTDHAWEQRWVIKNGLFPHDEMRGQIDKSILDQKLIDDGRVKWFRSDTGWEIDFFGRRQRMIEVTNRNVEVQVESWRNGIVFMTGEIGLFYTDLRVNEARIQLQKENIEFYKEVVNVVREKLELGGIAAIDLDEAKARLAREQAALPALERQRDAAKVQLARVIGVYSQDLDTQIQSDLPIPQPPEVVQIPKPYRVLMSRPDVRRLERRLGAQVARISSAVGEFYPKVSAGHVYQAGDDIIDGHGIFLGVDLVKRFLVGTDREVALVNEQKMMLQRELRLYEQGLVSAATEVESAIIDVQKARETIIAMEAAVHSNQKAFDRIYDAYREGLVDVRDIIRIRNDLFFANTELIFGKNQLAKGTVRLYKALGGIDIPPIPATLTPSEFDVTDTTGGEDLMSRIFSFNRDKDLSLNLDRGEVSERSEEWYHIDEDGNLHNGPEPGLIRDYLRERRHRKKHQGRLSPRTDMPKMSQEP